MTDPAAIIAELRQCTTVAQVESIADKYRPEVVAMFDDKELRARAFQIVNLKDYMIQQIRRENARGKPKRSDQRR